jgi:hypothetical protein
MIAFNSAEPRRGRVRSAEIVVPLRGLDLIARWRRGLLPERLPPPPRPRRLLLRMGAGLGCELFQPLLDFNRS